MVEQPADRAGTSVAVTVAVGASIAIAATEPEPSAIIATVVIVDLLNGAAGIRRRRNGRQAGDRKGRGWFGEQGCCAERKSAEQGDRKGT